MLKKLIAQLKMLTHSSKEDNKVYSKRVWLNKDESSSTGSLVAFHGKAKWHKNEDQIVTFLEVADCHGKSRLHKTYSDTMPEFISKLRIMASAIISFANWLEENL